MLFLKVNDRRFFIIFLVIIFLLLSICGMMLYFFGICCKRFDEVDKLDVFIYEIVEIVIGIIISGDININFLFFIINIFYCKFID